jgi:hypothetical protein
VWLTLGVAQSDLTQLNSVKKSVRPDDLTLAVLFAYGSTVSATSSQIHPTRRCLENSATGKTRGLVLSSGSRFDRGPEGIAPVEK